MAAVIASPLPPLLRIRHGRVAAHRLGLGFGVIGMGIGIGIGDFCFLNLFR